MSEVVGKIASELRRNGYAVEFVKLESEKKNFLGMKRTKTCKVEDAKAIENFCESYGPPISITFRYSRFLRAFREFEYERDKTNPQRWTLRYMTRDENIFLNDGKVKNVMEIDI